MAIKKKLRPNEILLMEDGSSVKNVTDKTVTFVFLRKEETELELRNQSRIGNKNEDIEPTK